jgi:aspartyl-tRNA(Asn)/glutamyl-tRNA(Gln) amidotransferase subunit B
LIEIVSEPDMRSAEEAVAYAKKLHSIVTQLKICDGEMSQGSMRFDVNISVRKKREEKLGTRTETKNLNSFRFMEKAIAKEVARQIEVIEDGGKIKQETRLYNGDTDTARSMRSKEEANDYRYFPCPDLLPVVIEQSYIDKLRKELPELPDARQARFVQDYQLSDYDASVLCGDADMAHFFEHTAKQCGDSKLAANWCMGEVSARLNAEEKNLQDAPITPEQLAALIVRIKDGTISSKMAKDVFEQLWHKQGSVDDIIKQQGGGQISDSGALEAIIDQVISASPQQTDNYRKAAEDKRPKMLGYFVGQVMKLSQGKANPQQVNDLLLKKLNG